MTYAGELSIEQRVTMLEARVARLFDLLPLADVGAKPERVRFCHPVGDDNLRCAAWPVGDWYVAQGYAQAYPPNMGRKDYHTGVDLNRPNYADSGSKCYAVADGEVVFAGQVSGWQLEVIVIKHPLEDGTSVWSRYAHLAVGHALRGQRVMRGDVIGTIGDYAPTGSKAGDHLHFDIAKIDLGGKPGDWPGADLQRLERDYLDPLKFIADRLR